MRVSKTIELRKVLKLEIEKVHATVYYADEVPTDAAYPYVVFELENISENYQLEIFVYDKGKSTRNVETIADNIDKYFFEYIYRSESQVFLTYKNVRNSPGDSDKSIKARRILFDITYYGKE